VTEGQGRTRAALPVSVVCCSYNGTDFIEDAMRSVAAQRFGDFEIILFDDCSVDDTIDKAVAMGDRRLRVVRAEERVPLGEARNRALAEAKGEWVAFIDQDDVWTPDKLALQVEVTSRPGEGPLGIVYGRTERFGAARIGGNFDPWYANRPLPSGDIFADLLARPAFIALSSALLSREALETIGPIPPWVRLCPDYYLFLALAKRYRVEVVEELCCLYRVHADSMSHVYAAGIHAEAFQIIEALADPGHAAIVRQRRKVANTLIAAAELRRGSIRSGLRRLFADGSVPYFLGRPFYHRIRSLMNSRRLT
jgi:glycosyltransferase involved in cell wall biosynthesis